MKPINIPNDFSKLPGPRYKKQGAHSGELFRETILQPRFEEAQRAGVHLLIQLDGATNGYPTSFLEESFGGLARIFGIDTVMNGLSFESKDEPMLVDEVTGYIRDANKTSKERAAP